MYYGAMESTTFRLKLPLCAPAHSFPKSAIAFRQYFLLPLYLQLCDNVNFRPYRSSVILIFFHKFQIDIYHISQNFHHAKNC
jgi:hypothetical protein